MIRIHITRIYSNIHIYRHLYTESCVNVLRTCDVYMYVYYIWNERERDAYKYIKL